MSGVRYKRQRCARAALKRDAAAWIADAVESAGNEAPLEAEAIATGLSMVARLTVGAAPMREACASSRCQIAILDRGADRWKLHAHGAAYEWGEADAFRVRVEAKGARVRFLPIP